MENIVAPELQTETQFQNQSRSLSAPDILKVALIGLLVLLPMVGFGGFYLGKNQAKISSPNPFGVGSPSPTTKEEAICTMDAKICPDGSAVGRRGPNCEFEECPPNDPAIWHDFSGWREVTQTECGNLKLRMPPADFQLENPSEMDKNRVWQLTGESLDKNYDPFTYVVSVFYQNKDGLGSGYVPGSVTIECAENKQQLSTAELLEVVKEQWESFNNGSGELRLIDKGETKLAGEIARKYELQGGMTLEGNAVYVVATRDYILRLNYISMSDNEKLKNTTKKIFDSIEF